MMHASDASSHLASSPEGVRANRRNLAAAIGCNLATMAVALAAGISPRLCAVVIPLLSLSVLLAAVAALSPGGTLWRS